MASTDDLEKVESSKEDALVEDESSFAAISLPPGLTLSSIPDSTYLLLAFTAIPAHPKDPLFLSWRWKSWMTTLAALLVMNTALASSAPSGAVPYIQEQFGGDATLCLSLFLFGYVAGPFLGAPLSEAYGRKPLFVWGTLAYTAFSGACIAAPNFGSLLVLRFFAGCFGSIPMTNSGAVCGDIWSPLQRGTAMSFYSVATFAGPSLGPIIGSFAAVHLGWRYDFVILTAIGAVLSLVVLVACLETYPPIIVSWLAKELRETTGDDRIRSRLELAEMASRGTPRRQRLQAESKRLLAAPIIMLFTESIVAYTTMFMSCVYALIYILFATYPIIFSEIHQLAPGYSSLPFLGIFVGALVSVPITLWYQKRYVADVKKLARHEPEMRLPPAEVGGILVALSFLWLGWSGYKDSIHWIVPTLSGIPQGVATVLIFRSLQTYLIDCYERNAASATAAIVVARSICAGVFPLFARSLFTNLGINWGCTLLAGLMLLLVPVPFIFNRYGARIRRRSRFTPGR